MFITLGIKVLMIVLFLMKYIIKWAVEIAKVVGNL